MSLNQALEPMVLTDMSSAQWDAALLRLPPALRDSYFTSAYHELHRQYDTSQPFYSLVTEGPESLFVSGLRSFIGNSDQHWDLESPNGYGGPLAYPDAAPDFLSRAWSAWKIACSRKGMVAAFFRLHPLLDNAAFLPVGAEIRADRQTVFIDVSAGTDPVWKAAASQHRNMVSKAARENARVAWNIPTAWDAFIEIYDQSMARLSAPSRLRFPHDYFASLKSLPGCEIASIGIGDSVTAAAVFLFGETWSHYHLAARAADSPNYAMNCLVQAAIERTFEKGLSGIHLGGGKSTATDDSLLKFKKSTGGKLRNFRVALAVTDDVEFSRLCEQWAQEEGAKPTWLLGYRQPQTTHSSGDSA